MEPDISGKSAGPLQGSEPDLQGEHAEHRGNGDEQQQSPRGWACTESENQRQGVQRPVGRKGQECMAGEWRLGHDCCQQAEAAEQYKMPPVEEMPLGS